MEDPRDRPTAADYAASEARAAQEATARASEKNKTLEDRVELLELKVRGLFGVLDHLLGGDIRDTLKFDEQGNIVTEGEDSSG